MVTVKIYLKIYKIHIGEKIYTLIPPLINTEQKPYIIRYRSLRDVATTKLHIMTNNQNQPISCLMESVLLTLAYIVQYC